MARFSGRKVLVTGASRGIGRAIAAAFREEGATVFGTSTKSRKPDEICNEWIAADFTDLAQIKSCAAKVREISPSILINNAGINKPRPFAEIPAEEFLLIQQVNVLAPFLLSQAAVPGMKAGKWGRIVNLSSVFSKVSKANRASYSASKFAVDGLTVALAAEHTVDGILANSVAPGFIDTDMTRAILGEAGTAKIVEGVPAGRIGNVEEIARLVLWLSSEENSFVAGQNIAIDGGFTRV